MHAAPNASTGTVFPTPVKAPSTTASTAKKSSAPLFHRRYVPAAATTAGSAPNREATASPKKNKATAKGAMATTHIAEETACASLAFLASPYPSHWPTSVAHASRNPSHTVNATASTFCPRPMPARWCSPHALAARPSRWTPA